MALISGGAAEAKKKPTMTPMELQSIQSKEFEATKDNLFSAVMTAYIQQMPNKMSKVRLNFLNSKNSSSAYGRSSSKDKPVLDPAVYNNAWEKIDEAIFVINALNDVNPAGSKSPTPVTPEADAPSVAAAPAVDDSKSVSETDD